MVYSEIYVRAIMMSGYIVNIPGYCIIMLGHVLILSDMPADVRI